MGAMTETVKELIDAYDKSPNSSFNKIITAGQIGIVSIGYDAMQNLQQARQTYGTEGWKAELVATGQTLGGWVVGGVGAVAGKFVPTVDGHPGKNFLKKASVNIGTGVAALETYNKYKIPGTDSTSKELIGGILAEGYDALSEPNELFSNIKSYTSDKADAAVDFFTGENDIEQKKTVIFKQNDSVTDKEILQDIPSDLNQNNDSSEIIIVGENDAGTSYNSKLSLSEGTKKLFDKFLSKEDDKIDISDNEGNVVDSFIKKDAILTDSQNNENIGTLGSLIEMGEKAANAISEFVSGGYKDIINVLNDKETMGSWAADAARMLANGEEVDDIVQYIFLKELFNNTIGVTVNDFIKDLAIETLPHSDYAKEAMQDAIAEGTVKNLPPEMQQAIADLLASSEYKIVSGSIISFITTIAFQHDEGLNSNEYTEIAAQAIVSEAIRVSITSALSEQSWAQAGNGAPVGGIVTAAVHIASAGIKDIGAEDSMNSHQWGSVVASGVALGIGYAIGQALIPIPILGGMIGTLVVGALMGGKEFKEGEYPDPYSFLQIEAKEDGVGNIIYGVEKEGVVAFAREHYHDDIYGTNGNDILVGRSGTNLLAGRGGDDLIEGRGDTDQIYGGDGNDIVEAGNENDYVEGNAGNDLLCGDGGDDILIGGEGNDIIYGGTGADRIEGNEGNDIIKGEDGNDIITAGSGNDNIEGGAGDDAIVGEAGDDEIDGGIGDDTLEGHDGVDILVGGEGNDNVKGGNDDDEIYGGKGSDILYGDSGSDIINGGENEDLIFGGIGNDIVYGGTGDDSIYGEIGNDYVLGGEGNDILDGFDGDDVLFAGKGIDTLDGGRGLDTFVFRAGDGQDTITDTDGTNDVIKFTNINSSQVSLTKDNNNLVITFADTNGNPTTDQITITDQLAGNSVIETLEFVDGKKIDLTTLTTNPDNTTNHTTEDYYNVDTAIQSGLAQEYSEELDIDARDQVNTDSTWYDTNYEDQANQEIENEHYNEVQWKSYKKKRGPFGGHYTVWYKYYEKNLKGTDGNDRLVGNWWSENLYGEGGDDQLYGNNGNDVIYGQDGNDYINGGGDNDQLYGGNGFDKIEGGTGNDSIYGGNQNDTLFGGWGNDTIYGNSHDDFIEGGEGDDTISGDITAAKIAEIQTEINNLSNPIYSLSHRFGFISKKFTTNPEQIAALQELITNLESGNDIILAGDGNDFVTGDEGNDLVIGNAGNDNLSGNEGNDTIYGRSGSDVIEAGAGDDYVSGGDGYDTINGNDGHDIIYGNGGVDVIYGNDGNDNIYGGSGNDQLFGNLGNDNIYGGSGTNIIEGNDGDDNITGGEDYDRIEGGTGNDTIFGRSGGDELYGNDGNDIISAGQGNDILTDGKGSDNLIGGAGNDIFIVTKNKDAIDSDTIEDFNASEDRIIVKVSYKEPITFTALQSMMSQVSDNVEINFSSGQKIIIKNTLLSDLNSDNIAVGLAGGENNDILFGTDSDNILFGEGGSDQIYGGAGNDELWGGKGTDSLYGEGGSDILKYEADAQFLSDTSTSLVGYSNNSYTYNGNLREYYVDEDIALKHADEELSSTNWLTTWTTKHRRGRWGGHYHRYHSRVDYANKYATKHYFVQNFINDEQININGYNRSFDSFDGGDGSDVLLMTGGNDMLALDDQTSNNPNPGSARVKDISVIYANDGDDIINFTTEKYNYGDIIIYGGNGKDRIWSSIGNDTLFGGSGDDEIFGSDGNDFISGGAGDDILVGGKGNDVIEGGDGSDLILGEEGDDIIEGGSDGDVLDGGEGNDTISYASSTAGVTVNIADNTASGGDAEGDTISNFENITGSAFVDSLTGDENDNIIEGGAGDDILTGGGGSDTYIWNIGDGNDTITDGINNHGDTITLDASVNKSDLIFEKSEDGNDLIIKIKGNDKDSLTIKDQLSGDSRIESISFANGSDSTINLENTTIIANEDEVMEINLDDIEQERILNQNISLIAAYGSANYNEDTGLITYTPNDNFNGIEELVYNIIDDEGNTVRSNSINLLLSPINDNPFGTVYDQEIMVDEQFSINLNDFFSDIDGDNLTYLVNAKDQVGLPHFLSLNEETGELSGIFGRDGKLTIEVSVSDGNGGIYSSNFDITANIDLSQRVVDIPDLQITNGTDTSDTLNAVNNQQDLISAGAGDDNINYLEDGIWQDSYTESFYAWNVYSGDKVSIAGRLQSFDSFDGGIGSDTLNLTDGNDVLFLDDPVTSSLSNSARLSGIEVINGGLGNDIIDLSSLNYEYGDVILNGGDGDDILWSNSGDDILNGGAGNDNLQAGTGNDILNGDEGDDVLKGHDGDETLIGGSGADILTGGFGFDSFNFIALDESTINQSDLITDFTQGDDSINFSNLGFTGIQQGEGVGTVLGYTYNQEDDITTIEDVNSDFAVQLTGKIDLVNSDFGF